jgi:hypothetical protein
MKRTTSKATDVIKSLIVHLNQYSTDQRKAGNLQGKHVLIIAETPKGPMVVHTVTPEKEEQIKVEGQLPDGTRQTLAEPCKKIKFGFCFADNKRLLLDSALWINVCW